MAKKNNIKKLFESTSIESADVHPESTDAQPREQGDATPPAENPQAGEAHEDESTAEQPILAQGTDSEETEPALLDSQAEPALPGANPQGEESSSEDVLDDVRRSLIEEESAASQKQSRWWRRLGRREKQPASQETTAPAEIDLPANADIPGAVETPAEPQATEDIEEIEDLIKILEAETKTIEAEPVEPPESEVSVEPAPEIDFDELKRQAFQPRAEEGEDQAISDVRSIALEGGEEVLVEVEAKPIDPMQERLQAVENAFKPYRRYIYYAMALLGVGMAVVASLILFNIYQQSRPEPVQQPASNLPYPTAVSLPGGWSFQLGRGTVQNGQWNPGGAEWLEGTEVCRWVSLPWSTQLEAVLRTLNPDDPIELTMSNNDKLTYGVYSIRQLTPEEMQQLDSNSPCLLIILTGSEASERWVLTALP